MQCYSVTISSTAAGRPGSYWGMLYPKVSYSCVQCTYYIPHIWTILVAAIFKLSGRNGPIHTHTMYVYKN